MQNSMSGNSAQTRLKKCTSGEVLPMPTPASDFDRKASAKELIPDNFGVFPEILKSLRSKSFFIYFVGQLFSLSGFWIQQIAMSWLVLRLSQKGDLVAFSTVVFLAQIPTLFLTPFSGVICDLFDRRKILICTQTLVMLQTFLLAILTLAGAITIPIIMALSLFFGVVCAFDAPARQSFYSRLVPAENLGNAVALNSIAINATRLIGPPIGGFLIGAFGEGFCFLINGLAFVAVLISLSMIKSGLLNFERTGKNPLGQIAEGFVYMWKSIPLRSIILLLAMFSFFGVPFVMVFPGFVKDVLLRDSSTLGLLMSCVGVGAIVCAFYLAARKSVLGLGKVVMLSCILFGVAEITMAFVRDIWLVGIICMPLGFGMIAVGASCNTLLQVIVDEDKRGRVMSIFTMCLFGIPPAGSLIYGFLSKSIGLDNVMIIAGIVCVVTGLIFIKMRPIIRKHMRKVYVKKGIISEIAVGLRSTNTRI